MIVILNYCDVMLKVGLDIKDRLPPSDDTEPVAHPQCRFELQ
jgi:hypothetical protein